MPPSLAGDLKESMAFRENAPATNKATVVVLRAVLSGSQDLNVRTHLDSPPTNPSETTAKALFVYLPPHR